ncbi:anthranilate 1,2-dioxygenase reductase component [Mariprofundus micogutta]|uniref:Anthranilate 1,2-dioxygenase reductase component n=1 Tax=Mariprofundus micogutta TaxID=1921010 RepID=A0A1L8CNV3_9PROT|nr:2Fe-2S iron-sulfur cluster binding domain-containing protein [Mariprofundus micogutta]GAV20563.1 anthranilate 1,2-dioxygenase reductase component [Mariprofundus micogutta]
MSQTYSIQLNTQDGKVISFDCAADSNLVDAAAQANITLPAVCHEGNCGACHGHCKSGDYELKSHSAGAISSNDEEHGGILMCRTFPRADMTVEVASDLAHITSGPVPEPVCEVLALDDMGGKVRRLLLKVLPDENGAVNSEFEPGQFMELEIPGTDIRRAYSISNAPNWNGELEFMIRLQPDGKFSSWLENDAKVGDQLNTKGPEGSFLLHQTGLAPRRFVAGGTGIAPMLSMLRLMAEFGETHESHLYFGLTTEDDLFAQAEIETLESSLPNLTAEVCMWKPGNAWQGFKGSPVDAFKRDLQADIAKGIKPDVYLCGPPGLIDAAELVAEELGLPQSSLFSERFLPG